MKKAGLAMVVVLLSLSAKGQLSFLGKAFVCQDSAHCETGVKGMLPSKWISFSYEKSSPFRADGGATGISQFRRADARIRLPLINRDGLKVIMGLAYRQEYMGVSRTDSEGQFPWQALDQQRLNHRGLDLVWLTPFRGHTYLVGRASAAISNAHRGFDWWDYRKDLQFSLSELMIFRPSETEEFGLGVYVRRAQGRTASYPLLMYNRTFSNRWGLETLLPSYVRVRRNLSPTSGLLFQVKASGGAYNLDFPGLVPNAENVSLRRSELRAGITYQQEIVDPLWIGLEVGFRQPFSLGVFDPSAPRTAVLSSNLGASSYLNASLFLVPPKKLMDKMRKKRQQ